MPRLPKKSLGPLALLVLAGCLNTPQTLILNPRDGEAVTGTWSMIRVQLIPLVSYTAEVTFEGQKYSGMSEQGNDHFILRGDKGGQIRCKVRWQLPTSLGDCTDNLGRAYYIVFGLRSDPPPKTDFVVVEPFEYVPPPPTPIPGSKFGWLPTDAADANTFRLRVGTQQFSELLNRAGAVDIKQELGKFAEQQIVDQNLCPTGAARSIRPPLVQARSGEYVDVWVECAKQ